MKIILVYHEHNFESFVDKVYDYLTDKSVEVIKRERQCMSSECYKDTDFVVVIGGDGTFLRASHMNKDVPMFGINPEPSKKEGFFMQSTIEDYEKFLDKILNGKYDVVDLMRLSVLIDDKMIPEFILNDIFIGDEKPYNMFNYNIEINDKKDFHRGSGLLVGTPAGSHAWLKSAGGQIMEITERKYQYVARDLYRGRLTSGFKLIKDVLSGEEIIKVFPNNSGILVVDSVSQEYRFEKGSEIVIKKSGYDLKYLQFN